VFRVLSGLVPNCSYAASYNTFVLNHLNKTLLHETLRGCVILPLSYTTKNSEHNLPRKPHNCHI